MATPTGSATSQEAAAKIKALMDGPAGTPPVGVLSNFNNPPNLDTEIILTLALCMAVATLAVTMRMYTKIALIKSLAYEDCKCSNQSCNYLNLTTLRRYCHIMGLKMRSPSTQLLTLSRH